MIKKHFIPVRPGTLYILLCLVFSSCEKAINFNLDDVSPRLVVEATIENNEYPVVILSQSIDYFSSITPEQLANSFVHDATVIISNGLASQQLKEYSVKMGTGFSLYYYTIDSSNLSTAFKGQVNTSYTLQINTNGKQYTAATTIPLITRRIDSLFSKPAPPLVDTSKAVLVIKATDAPGYGDYVRYFTKRNSEPFYPGLNSVFDDQVIDGASYEIEVERGVDRNTDLEEDYAFFNKGDTVTLKLCQIDKATYDFWRTMEYSYASIGNPFSTPTKVLGNISNGALGYFGGYGCQYRTVIIPR